MRTPRVLILALLMFYACGLQYQQFYRELDGQINVMTYDQALMRFGQPTSIAPGQDVFVATWFSNSSSTMVVPTGNSVIAMPINHGEELRLTFNRSTNRLAYWTHRHW